MSTVDWGSETVVNTIQAGDQSAPQISALSNGGWVVVWETGSVGSQTASGQVFNAAGVAVGGQLSFAGTSSEQVHVTDSNDGTFYVVWLNNPQILNNGPPNTNGVITVQQFNDNTAVATGNPVTYPSLFAPPPPDAIGSLAVATGPDGADTTGQNPQQASGQIVYGTSTSDHWGYQSTSSGSAGETSTGGDTWTNVDGGYTDGAIGIVATDASTGNIEFQWALFGTTSDVSTDTGTTNGDNAHIAALPGGESVIVFQGKETGYTSGYDIFAAVYGTKGNGAGLLTDTDVTTTQNGNFPVSDSGDQTNPNVVSLGNNNIFVTWINGSQVVGQELNYGNVDGSYQLTDVGSPIVINTTVVTGSSTPAVAALADGRIVVAYQSSDASGFGIREQILDLRNGVITGVGNNATFYGPADNSNVVMTATGQSDTLNAGNGNDSLFGEGANDTFALGNGSNMVTAAGGGLNIAQFSSALSAADFTFSNNEWVAINGASTDNLSGISEATDGAGHTFLLVGGGSQYATDDQAFTSAQFHSGDIIIGTATNSSIAITSGLSNNRPTSGTSLQATVSFTGGDAAATPITYTWFANGSSVQSGTSSSYTPTLNAVGATVTVDASFTDQFGDAIVDTSAATGPVLDGTPLPHAANSNIDEWILSNGRLSTSAQPGSIPSGYQAAGTGDFTGTARAISCGKTRPPATPRLG